MENYFTDIELFSGLSSEDQELLSGFCQMQSYSDGDVIFEQGDEAQAMYVIVSGQVKVYKDESLIVMLWEGNIIGEMALLEENSLRNATLKALGQVQLITIIRFSVDQMFVKYPKLKSQFFDIIESRK